MSSWDSDLSAYCAVADGKKHSGSSKSPSEAPGPAA